MSSQRENTPYPEIGKKEYMERFEKFFSARQMRLLRAAYAFSKIGHNDQVRDDGRRYFDHARATSWIAVDELKLYDCEFHLTLLLHDIVEDTYLLTLESIEMFFGEDVAIMVHLLTHGEESTATYVDRIRESAQCYVMLAKLIDRLHNLRTIDGCPVEKRQRKLKETVEFYVPLGDYLVETIHTRHRHRAEYVRDQIHHELERWQSPPSATS